MSSFAQVLQRFFSSPELLPMRPVFVLEKLILSDSTPGSALGLVIHRVPVVVELCDLSVTCPVLSGSSCATVVASPRSGLIQVPVLGFRRVVASPRLGLIRTVDRQLS